MASNIDLFQEVDQQYTARPDKALWTINLDDPAQEKAIQQWLWSEVEYLKEENRERFTRILRCQALYRGMQYVQQETREERFIQHATQIQKITVNQIFDLVQQKVSRLIKYRPGIAVLPSNDEFKDKLAAENIEGWLSYIWYTQRFDGILQPEFVQATKVDGEAYLFVEWDQEKGEFVGEFDADMQAKLKAEGSVTLMDGKGNPMLDEQGKPIVITGPVYKGDVTYRLVRTTDVLVDKQTRYEDSNYIFWREVLQVEEARLRYPEGAHNIGADPNAIIYDHEKLQVRKTRKNEVVLWHFYHKRTKAMPKGREIIFTSKGIVKNTPSKYSHRRFPCARLIDVNLPHEIHGYSGINLISPIHGVYNNATNAIIKNQMLVAYPKWMMPAGSAKIESLGNDITIVQYKGPIAPQLVQMNPTAPEMFSFREKLKEEMQQVYGIYGVSRGEPPPGIKAGVALQFLAEQESERQNEDVLRYNDWLKDVAELTIAVAADFYSKDEKRMIRIMGQDKAWTTTAFDPKHLSKAYDIRVQNSSALPQSKAARIQTLLDLREAAPNSITEERLLDLLDFGQEKKFMDQATASVRAAEAENEALLNPESPLPCAEPQEYEDHIQHWQMHAIRVRSWDFKNRIPAEVQKLMVEHIQAHEYLMAKKAMKEPEFKAQLATLKGFPMFFVMPDIATMAATEEAAMMASPGPMSQGVPAPEAAMVAPPAPPITEPMPPVEMQKQGMPMNEPMPPVENQTV